jgi:hypothetical protein
MKICPICNQQHHKNENKTCSRKCAAQLANINRKRPPTQCPICKRMHHKSGQITCSLECGYELKQINYNKRNPKRFKPCIICGTIKKNPNIKTCGSDTCYRKMQSLNNLERYKNDPNLICPICGNRKKYGTAKTCSKECGKIFYKKNCLRKYGVEYPMQLSSVYEKSYRKCNKKYTFPSGNTYTVQGYENIAIDMLLSEGYTEDDIQISNRPTIKYFWSINDGGDDKWHYYHPDIIIPKENRIIEVKSEYTVKRDRKLKAKELGAIKSGFSFTVLVIAKPLT